MTITEISTDESKKNKIYVDDFIVDLIPNFIKNKLKDLELLGAAIEKKDSDIIKKIGHNWKGVCASYGFDSLAEVGSQLEILAENADFSKIKVLVENLPKYLENVQIISISSSEENRTTYADTPTKT